MSLIFLVLLFQAWEVFSAPHGNEQLVQRAYQDLGNCGPEGGDFNYKLCPDQNGWECPATISDNKCSDGKAYRRVWHPRTSSKPEINIDGCNYWFWAEYYCVLKTPVKTSGYAGEYEAWIRGVRRENNLIINSDNTVTDHGLSTGFTDALHFIGVSSKCNQGHDAESTMFILNTHGGSKHECLHAYGDGILKGSHYTSVGNYWGPVEYRRITECTEGEEDKTNPCQAKTCIGGKWTSIIIDCAEHMAPESCSGKWEPAKEGECCSTCIEEKTDLICKQGIGTAKAHKKVGRMTEKECRAQPGPGQGIRWLHKNNHCELYTEPQSTFTVRKNKDWVTCYRDMGAPTVDIHVRTEAEVGGTNSVEGSFTFNTLLGAAFIMLAFYVGYVYGKKPKGQKYKHIFGTDEIEVSNM